MAVRLLVLERMWFEGNVGERTSYVEVFLLGGPERPLNLVPGGSLCKGKERVCE